MSKTLTLLLTVIVVVAFVSTSSADIWDGPTISFTKEPGADFTQPENQDIITAMVAITRGDSQGIFNIAQEFGYSGDSPADTEWAYGTTADIESLVFSDWVVWHDFNPPSSLGRDAVLHLISEDIYIDIRFTSWSVGGGSGGGFSYIRSTAGNVPEPTSGLVLITIGGSF